IALLTGMEQLSAEQTALRTNAINILTQMYPHLNGKIEENIGWITNEINMMTALNNASGGNAATLMANQDNTTKATVAAVNQRIAAYDKELKALKRVYDAERAKAMADPDGTLSAEYVKAGSRIYELERQMELERATSRSTAIKALYDGGVRSGDIKLPKSPSSKKAKSKESDAAREAEEAQKRVLEIVNKQIDAY